VITARGLEKRFGEKRVLSAIDLDLPAGGFLLVTGRNGSGKSTLLRLFASLLAPTAGRLEVVAPRGAIGFVGHEPLLYPQLTAVENLDLYGRLYRVRDRRRRADILLDRFALGDARSEPVSTYSRGMQQRLALCRALLHEPRLLLLDEPYSGLDRVGSELLDAELGELAAVCTIVVSSHQPERLEVLATAAMALR
jgi:ABC-type multidrug transport system ATPase subunit